MQRPPCSNPVQEQEHCSTNDLVAAPWGHPVGQLRTRHPRPRTPPLLILIGQDSGLRSQESAATTTTTTTTKDTSSAASTSTSFLLAALTPSSRQHCEFSEFAAFFSAVLYCAHLETHHQKLTLPSGESGADCSGPQARLSKRRVLDLFSKSKEDWPFLQNFRTRLQDAKSRPTTAFRRAFQTAAEAAWRWLRWVDHEAHCF